MKAAWSSSTTMQAASSSLNAGFCVKPSAV